jgi:sulfoquinovosidase
MDLFSMLIICMVGVIAFISLAFFARHARNGFVRWGLSLGAFVVALVFLVFGLKTSVAWTKYNLPPMNPTLISQVNGSYPVGNFVLSFAEKGQLPALRVTHTAEPNRVLWASIPNVAFVGAAAGEADIREFGTPEGSFSVNDKIITTCTAQSIDSVETTATGLVLRGKLSGPGCAVQYRLTFTPVAANQLQFHLQIEGAQADVLNRIYLRAASDPDEHFFGFGEQLTYFDQKGKIIPILVQEHGVGRGLPVFTQLVDWTQNGGGGDPFVTEAPVPHYMTSKLSSVFLENPEYSVFDMHHPDRIEITLFANQMTGRILYGKTPLDLIQAYTDYSGRMRALPDWIQQGAVISVQGGTDIVKQKLDTFVKAGVPIAAFWIQDWPGKRVTSIGSQLWWNWKLDETLYPDWNGLVDALQKQNARVMIYINPFLTDAPGHNELFNQAEHAGYLVKKKDGTPYLIKNTDFFAGLVDLSNPAAREWMKQIIKNELISHARASGWMTDFGEALPFDSVLYGSANPKEWHNRYPEEWAQVNREAIQEAGREDDIVFFDRSGFTQSPGHATLFWLGDQLQTWDEYDGIKTAVVGLLSGGVSGFSLLHSDTGGYNAFSINLLGKQIPIIARSKELLMRWVELSAFTSVMRTHEGLNPAISVQVDSDPETLAHFARMVKIYQALGFYRKQLLDEAARTGHPVVRHPFLEYPNDPNTYALRYQYMFGSEFMFAPVVNAGANSVRLYLPAGNWTNVWTGETLNLTNGKWVEVAAPLGKPALFYKTGSAIGEQFVAALKANGLY